MPTTDRDQLLKEYLDAQQAADLANRLLKERKEQLLAQMQFDQVKSTSMQVGNQIFKATYVAPVRVKIDEKGLRRALTAKVYDKFTVKTLDRKKMEEAMDRDEIDSRVVAKFCTPAEVSPSLRVSSQATEEEL